MTRFLFTAFVGGFATLSTEILASRVMAPLVGNSLYTWTSIIGVVLAGMAAGSYVGGKIIDARPYKSILALLILASAIAIAFVPLLARLVQGIITWDIAFLIRIFLSSVLLFFLPSFFLGSLYPATLKLYAREKENIGTRAGILSGAGSLGGIAGAFLSGFFLISNFGTATSLYGIAFLLLFTAILWERRRELLVGATIIISVILLAADRPISKNIIFETESPYYAIKVVEGKVNNVYSKLLFLDFDIHSIEGTNSLGTYQETAPIFSVFKPDIKKALVLGGGSFNMPKDLFRLYKADVTVVEIDPQVTETARKFFDLDRYPLTIMHADARIALKTLPGGYDIIVNDAFNSFISMPWHLATVETYAAAKKLLNPDGIYIVNLISSLEGKESGLYQSMLKTFAKVFPEYHVLTLGQTRNKAQNIFLIGVNGDVEISTSAQELTQKAKDHGRALNVGYLYKPAPESSAIVFTDEFAPLEWALSPLVFAYIEPSAEFYHSIVWK